MNSLQESIPKASHKDVFGRGFGEAQKTQMNILSIPISPCD